VHIVFRNLDGLPGLGSAQVPKKRNPRILVFRSCSSHVPKIGTRCTIVSYPLSSNSTTKEGYIQKEIKDALDVAAEKPEGTIFIIPARLENCNTPDRLQIYHWVNLYEPDGYRKLFRSLHHRAQAVGATFADSTSNE
jgi:hypothetical protein